MVEGGQHRNAGQLAPGGRRGGERGRTGVHGHQVVHPGAGHQLAVAAQVGGRLDAVHHQVPALDVGGRYAGLLGDEGDQIALGHLAQAPDRRHVALLVQLQAVGVHRAVEVHGKLGHSQQRPVDMDEPVAAVTERHPPAQPQVAVEPGVEQRAAVDLDGDLPPAPGAGVRNRFDAQIGRVCVCTDNSVRSRGACALGHVPGDDRAAAQHILPAGPAVPFIDLGDLPEPGLVQPLRRIRHRVVGRRTGGEEGHEVVGVAAIEAGGVGHGFSIRSRTPHSPCACIVTPLPSGQDFRIRDGKALWSGGFRVSGPMSPPCVPRSHGGRCDRGADMTKPASPGGERGGHHQSERPI